MVSPSFIASSSSQTVEAQANEEEAPEKNETKRERRERERAEKEKAIAEEEEAKADQKEAIADQLEASEIAKQKAKVALKTYNAEKAELELLIEKIALEKLEDDEFDEKRATLRIEKQQAVVDVAKINKEIAAKESELERAMYNLLVAIKKDQQGRISTLRSRIEKARTKIKDLKDSRETEEGEEKATGKDEKPGDKVARLCRELDKPKKKK